MSVEHVPVIDHAPDDNAGRHLINGSVHVILIQNGNLIIVAEWIAGKLQQMLLGCFIIELERAEIDIPDIIVLQQHFHGRSGVLSIIVVEGERNIGELRCQALGNWAIATDKHPERFVFRPEKAGSCFFDRIVGMTAGSKRRDQ